MIIRSASRPVSGFLLGLLALASVAGLAEDLPREEAAAALQRAVRFFHQEVAVHGGYVYRYSADLKKREGEEKAGPETVWVQPPGTPAVGLAYLDAWQRTRAPFLLEAARSAGDCLVRGQLRSGGWAAFIDLSPEGRRWNAYRLAPESTRGANWTTFDDNKTQSALTFLMRLDQALEFRDERIHEAAQFALESVLRAQYPNGAWPQGYREFPDPARHPVQPASYPREWSRTFPGTDYRGHYTFNDNALADTIEMLLLAERIYQEPRYRAAAVKAGQFILLAQMPEPQPAWAQQYDSAMHPAWARKFEPPAISGGESQGILRILLRLYVETEDRKFLEPVPRAIAYLRRSRIAPGKLARFYELQSNRPLYFTRQYELTYDDRDVPTHYGFQVSEKLDSLEREYDKLRQATAEQLAGRRQEAVGLTGRGQPAVAEVRRIVAALDDRGAWVEDGRLRSFGADDETRQVIDTATFIRHVGLLSRYLESRKSQ